MLVALLIAASIAGHPVGIKCDAEINNPFPFPVDGWAYVGGNELHMTRYLCDALERRDTNETAFARALGTLIHEAAHTRGVESEACAELYAQVLVYQVLRDHYRIPFFTRVSRRVGEAVARLTSLLPPAYQPTQTSCDQEP